MAYSNSKWEIFGHIEDPTTEADEDRPDKCVSCGNILEEYASGSSYVFWCPADKVWLCNNTDCLMTHNGEVQMGCIEVLAELGYNVD